ncbi:NADH dehydrogenase I subunit C protein [Halorhabdus tiamatea SARL4B]|uniref:NADH dehydrogenase I subunit C protein n=1 Tax=Halorhabdus tiamatea SARL4B TaxID=1033806 RepID=F7PQ40_9EURY|nr:NADH-quinone oxidoreductase subunit C [Halorhabdus tiamatea]ERJ07219.1 NADH dehydrogenase I subunit C protein [Halorhabdus tiamatea SARL4B]CCQ34132.1 NADH-ubiquinone oxidoreductase, chain C [Halorhabdus tiamatea SARL4B]
MTPSQLKRKLDDELSALLAASEEHDCGRLEFVLADRGDLVEAVTTLQELGITHLITITGVDAGDEIEVLYHFLRYGEYDDGDLGEGVELTIRAIVPKADPTIETLTDVLPGATLYERELMDMLGVEVTGHPNPEKLLLADDFDGGPPLRAENLEVN